MVRAEWTHLYSYRTQKLSTPAAKIVGLAPAKTARCQVFIGAGSQAEYGRVEGVLTAQTPCFPENGYGMAKLCAGQMSRVECQTLGMAHIWTRILSVYGPHDGPATMILSLIHISEPTRRS